MPADRTVCIVDDDEAVRDSLEVLFEAEGFTVATFASARDFLVAGPARAGCVVTDLRMPEMNGLELLAALAERPDAPPVLMITGHGDVPMAVRAMKLGAADFIEKPFDPQLLVARVRDTLRAAGPAEAGAAALRAEIARRLELLTPREREVLEQLVAGRSNKAIGLELDISPRTVEIHRARVMEKMAVDSLAALVRLALAAGIDPGATRDSET
jgi:two-component system, LuxR family, response regulator FixJ